MHLVILWYIRIPSRFGKIGFFTTFSISISRIDYHYYYYYSWQCVLSYLCVAWVRIGLRTHTNVQSAKDNQTTQAVCQTPHKQPLLNHTQIITIVSPSHQKQPFKNHKNPSKPLNVHWWLLIQATYTRTQLPLEKLQRPQLPHQSSSVLPP